MAKIPGIEDPKSDVLQLVNQWLGSSESGAWLLILDNADDAELFFGPLATQAGTDVESTLLSGYLPQTGAGSILITSRDQGAAFKFTGVRKQVLPIDVMSKDDTFALLTKKLPEDPSDRSVKEELIVELDSVPLAITQASAYITVHAPRMTVLKYLQMLQQGDQNQVQILSKNEADLRRDPGVPNSVIRTWQMSFWKIKSQNSEAADLLACMCMLDRQGIPEFLICEDGEPSLLFEEAISVLTRYSLVREEKEQKVFAIHRLVQLATRTWIETSGDLEKFQKEALRLVCQQYPEGAYENWTVCEALEPHAQIVLDYIHDSKDCQLQQAAILHNGASYAWMRGRFKKSEEMLQKSLDIQGVYLEADDPNSLATLSLVAATYVGQGRWKEAERLNLQSLEVSKRVLGAEHQRTLATIGSLASIYHSQARWTEAERLHIQILDVSKRVLGAEHPDTLTTMSNLASTYRAQSRWTEAEKLNLKVLEVQRRVSGGEHPDTLAALNNLALVYCKQARWTEAEKLNLQVLQIMRRVFGVEHPHTLISIHNLATTYNGQGRWAEAEELEALILGVERRVLGAEHPNTLASMNSLAHSYHRQHRLSEAIELMEKVIELASKSLGADHANTMTAMGMLALWYHEQNRRSEGIELMEKVVELSTKVLGPEHPETIDSTNRLAEWRGTQNPT